MDHRRQAFLPETLVIGLRRRLVEGAGLAALAVAVLLLAALITYDASDASWNTASDTKISNLVTGAGAKLADILLQGLGAPAFLPVLILIVWAWRLIAHKGLRGIWLRLAATLAGVVLAAIALAALPPPAAWAPHAGLGGALGWLLLPLLGGYLELSGITFAIPLTAGLAALLAIAFLVYASGLGRPEWLGLWGLARRAVRFFQPPSQGTIFDPREVDLAAAAADRPGGMAKSTKRRKKARGAKQKKAPVFETKKPRTATAKGTTDARQGSLCLAVADHYQLPPLDLLEAPPAPTQRADQDREALGRNAKLLETVLQDFGIRGEIVKVRPGPVITLYELEPAPGIKTSRVIGLSDDIARSMSALSVRMAVVPGRSVIGIELPNADRETVYFRELLASRTFERDKGALTLALGKDIGGASTLVDLATMPHLLIAGTTGSGKSVAVNTMILSLLYRYGPDKCRFIMIDPKMLELSVYDGIPSLLSPVVTEPGKAVVALKWTVREMEERYRTMSQLGVRNIASYNARLAEALKKGEALTRRVQTGFEESGKPIFEEQPLDMEPLPLIVVVVDEMADLMIVAGKDIEAAIQRLAQMARAAGIHLIMATQRPSVDVITGTIKANFPTRVSFQVTSKIDSRTILGEPGAEQLLGRGDMLYMAGGGQIRRIHGPFVSDEEVEAVVNFLKSQGQPEYNITVTEEADELFTGEAGKEQSGDALYDEAVAIIAREGKASTSFIQRHLQIGYNRAARIIERMEEQGVVSKADRVGRREVLVGSHD